MARRGRATLKYRLGKLPRAELLAAGVLDCIRRERFEPLAIEISHAERAGRLPGPHKDPFDRMLIAQALEEDLVVLSNEGVFDLYGVRRLW